LIGVLGVRSRNGGERTVLGILYRDIEQMTVCRTCFHRGATPLIFDIIAIFPRIRNYGPTRKKST